MKYRVQWQTGYNGDVYDLCVNLANNKLFWSEDPANKNKALFACVKDAYMFCDTFCKVWTTGTTSLLRQDGTKVLEYVCKVSKPYSSSLAMLNVKLNSLVVSGEVTLA